MNDLIRLQNETENRLVNLTHKAVHEIETNKLVDIAIGAIAVGTVFATRGRLTNLIADFPRASELLGSNADAAGTSETLGGCASGAESIQAIAEKNRQDAIKKLAMLMTRNSEAATAARAASEATGSIQKGQTSIAGKSIGLVIFEHATEGARAFLDKSPGNQFTAYLNSLHESEISRILGHLQGRF
jgi:hypothetical protein